MNNLKIKKIKVIVFLIIILIINIFCIGDLIFNYSKIFNNRLSDTFTKLIYTEIKSVNNYHSYKIKNVEDLEIMTQEWYKLKIEDTYDIRFKYEYIDGDNNSKLKLYINNIEISDDTIFTDDDKYNFIFHEFGDVFVIEHELINDDEYYVYFYLKNSGELYKLEDEDDYYLTGYDISEEGINLSYTIIKSYTDPVLKNGSTLNICSDKVFKERKSDTFYYEVNYEFNGINLTRIDGTYLTFNKVKNNKKIINACRSK